MAEGFEFNHDEILRAPDPDLEIVDGHAVKNPVDYQDPDALYESLVAKITKYPRRPVIMQNFQSCDTGAI